eukprot:SAG11_NODE_184_length_13162_cov_9.151803_8_plen_103_part_00
MDNAYGSVTKYSSTSISLCNTSRTNSIELDLTTHSCFGGSYSCVCTPSPTTNYLPNYLPNFSTLRALRLAATGAGLAEDDTPAAAKRKFAAAGEALREARSR